MVKWFNILTVLKLAVVPSVLEKPMINLMRATGSSFITPSTFLQISDHVSCCVLSNQDLSLPGAGHQDLGVHDQQSDQYDQLL